LNNFLSEFDSPPNRVDTSSLKWEKYADSDIIPLWVADMDFKSPQSVIDQAKISADHGNFGYGCPPKGLVELLISRCSDLYDWEINPKWIVWLPGMVCALNVCCRALLEDSSQAIIQTPIYPPFLTASRNFNLPLVKVPLVLEGSRFTIDFNSLATLKTNPGDLFMLCHPHNPVGTLFNKDELLSLTNWIVERDLYLCSDEIHCDLILGKDLHHISPASLTSKVAEKTITLMAPSKTFNIAGFGCSFAIISNSELRFKFKRAMRGIVPDPPAMGFLLADAAYREGEPWRLSLIDYLQGNRELAMIELAGMDGLVPYSPEATYLLWIDARTLPVDNPHEFFEKNGVGLSDGADFDAPGFLRLNLGCARKLLTEALARMSNACKKLRTT
jgi:cysteine-S-conjugate beta-lyase